MENNFKQKPWVLQKIVMPQHTDHAGVMWHGSYISWLEEARINALSEVGISYADLSKDGYEMPVVDMHIKYINAINHGEEVILNSWSYEPSKIRLNWKTIFTNKDGKNLAEALVCLVLLQRINDGTRIIRKKPYDISKALMNLKKGPI